MNFLCFGLFGLIMVCEPSAAPSPAITACPPLRIWTPEFQSRLADELEKLPENSALAAQMRQHAQLRDQIRRCKKK